jgi:hypothetical protein
MQKALEIFFQGLLSKPIHFEKVLRGIEKGGETHGGPMQTLWCETLRNRRYLLQMQGTALC